LRGRGRKFRDLLQREHVCLVGTSRGEFEKLAKFVHDDDRARHIRLVCDNTNRAFA